MSSQLADVFSLTPTTRVVGFNLPDPPRPEARYEVVRFSIERGNGLVVEYGTGLSEVFRAFVGRGANGHEFYAEAMPVGTDPDTNDVPTRRCEWTQDGGWGKWHRG